MTAIYIQTFNGKHGIDYTTDSGKKGFIHGILDADTARTLAAGPEAIALLREFMSCFPIPPTDDDGTGRRGFGDKIKTAWAKSEALLTNLHAQK